MRKCKYFKDLNEIVLNWTCCLFHNNHLMQHILVGNPCPTAYSYARLIHRECCKLICHHAVLNDIIHRALATAVLEPYGMWRIDGKRPNEWYSSLGVWAKHCCGTSRVSDTFASSHLQHTSWRAGSTDELAERLSDKYQDFSSDYLFTPFEVKARSFFLNLI